MTLARATLLAFAAMAAGCANEPSDDTWSTPVSLGDAGQQNALLAIAGGRASVALAPGGQGAVVWERHLPDASEIWASRFAPGAGWSAARRIQGTDASQYGYEAELALDDQGNGFVVWLELDAAGTRLLVSRTTPAGFDPAVALGHTSEAETPVLDFDQKDLAVERGGNALVAWRAGGAIHAWHLRSGGGWSGPATFDPRGAGASPGSPRTSAGGAVGLLTWYEAIPLFPRPRAVPDSRVLDFGSGLWSQGDAPEVGRALIDTAGGRLMVAKPHSFFPTLVASYRFEPSSGWQRITLSPTTDHGFVGPAGRADGHAIVLLTREDTPAEPVPSLAARRFVPGQGWSAAETLSVAPGRASSLVLDQAGRASFLQGPARSVSLTRSTGAATWTTEAVPALPNNFTPEQCGSTTARPVSIGPLLAVDGQGALMLVRPAWDCRTTTLFAQRRSAGTL